MTSTINTAEIDQFQKDSAHWWDESGPFAPLHRINPVRMEFMVGVMETHQAGAFKKGAAWTHLDVGCGGGLVAEPFARLGARVTGLDADEKGVAVAAAHATGSGLSIDYHAQSIEDFRGAHPRQKFETITALEIIEHVDAPDLFLDEIAAMSAEGGIVFISTLNRTLKSIALGVVAAEYILGWVPRGTHNPRKFIKPSELTREMRARGFDVIGASGIAYHPLRSEFFLSPHDLDVNYIMAFQKA